jgi:hypothetical protein
VVVGNYVVVVWGRGGFNSKLTLTNGVGHV